MYIYLYRQLSRQALEAVVVGKEGFRREHRFRVRDCLLGTAQGALRRQLVIGKHADGALPTNVFYP